MWQKIEQWDVDLFIYINNQGSERFDSFWVFVTRIENWILLYIIFFFLFFLAYSKRKAIIGTASTITVFIISLGLTTLVKHSVARVRPNNVPELKTLIRVLQTPVSYSFFSGHAAVSFAITTFVVLALRSKLKWVYVFYVWPIIFAISRIFVGVHYPGDILVGTIVGICVSFLTWKYARKKMLNH